jgi:hypothetical protein
VRAVVAATTVSPHRVAENIRARYDQVRGHMEDIVVTVNLARAKAHLSELLDKVEAGEEV